MTPAKLGLMIVTTPDRTAMLDECLTSIARHETYGKEPMVYLVGDGHSDQEAQAVTATPAAAATVKDHVFIDPAVGPHLARVQAIDAWNAEVDAWVVLDDDMLLIPETNYTEPVEAVQERGMGLVSCNWGRTQKDADKKGLKREWKKQNIVFTGGGLVLSAETAQVIRDAVRDDESPYCDNSEWSLASYLSGRENWRYLGSLAIHRILSKGGRKQWITAEKPLPDERYLVMEDRKSKPGRKKMPSDANLQPAAKLEHSKNRTMLMGLPPVPEDLRPIERTVPEVSYATGGLVPTKSVGEPGEELLIPLDRPNEREHAMDDPEFTAAMAGEDGPEWQSDADLDPDPTEPPSDAVDDAEDALVEHELSIVGLRVLEMEGLPLWRIDDIKPYWRNPRNIKQKDVDGVAESIRRYGYNQPIVVDKDGIIIVGHTRYKACKQLGVEKVAVLQRTNLHPDLVREYRLADNSTGEGAEWNREKMTAELRTIEDAKERMRVLMPSHNLEDLLEQARSAATNLPSQDEIRKKEESLAGTFTDRGQEAQDAYIDLTCPHCDEDFAVSKGDFLKRVEDQTGAAV